MVFPGAVDKVPWDVYGRLYCVVLWRVTLPSYDVLLLKAIADGTYHIMYYTPVAYLFLLELAEAVH